MKTIRREMERILAQAGGTGARDLSQALHIPERDVYAHLEHLARSVRARGLRLGVQPARCLDCGFVFRERKKLAPPGHCPRCKGSHLQRPRFFLEQK